MTRSRQFFGGLAFGYTYQALVMVAGLWLTPFLLKHLGQHDYGLWLVGLQTLTYLVLMDFGIVALLPRETAYATGHAIRGVNDADLSLLIGRTSRVVLWQTPVVAIGAAVIWFCVPMGHEIRGPLLVALIGFVVLFPLRIFQAVLHGLQETPYLGRMQVLGWTLSTVTMIVMVLFGLGLYGLAAGWVLGQLVPSVLSFYRLKVDFPGVLPSRLPKLAFKELLRALTGGTWVSVAQIAQLLIAGTDYVVIGKVLGASAVVPYACTQKLISVLSNQPHMIMEMAAPGLSQMKTSESRDRIFRACNALTVGMLTASGLIACAALAVNHSFVTWWVGARQFGGELLTVTLVVSMLLRHWNTSAVYTIFALGHERRISITTLADGVVNVATSVFLVWRFGAIGAPVGTILGVVLVSLPGNLSALAGELRVSVLKVVSSIWSWFWRFFLVAGVAGLLGLRWRANFLYAAGLASVTTILYAAIMLPMIMNSDLGNYVPERVRRFLELAMRRCGLGRSEQIVQNAAVAGDAADVPELEAPRSS